MKLSISILVFLAASTSIALGQDAEAMKKEVQAVDAARVAALKAGDGDAWATTIADDCFWVDMSKGELTQNKSERAGNISQSGGFDPGAVSGVQWHFAGPSDRIVQTGTNSRNGKFSRVYIKNDGKWQMIALYVENFPAQ